jgi:hypothetical protein
MLEELNYIGSFSLSDYINVSELSKVIEDVTNDEKSSITVRILTADLLETTMKTAKEVGIIT